MPITHDSPAPYSPVAHVLKAIDQYRRMGTSPISKENLMRIGLPDTYANRALRSLKMLDLVDDEGSPTASLKELRTAVDEEYRSRLEQIVRTAYGTVFEVVDPAKDSEEAVLNAFAFNTPPAQRDKMVVLFLGLCQEAGILPPEKAPRKRSMKSAGTAAAPRPNNGKPRTPKPSTPGAPQTPPLQTPPAPQAATQKQRYIDMLLSKAEAQDQLDDKLLDRIEALLREDEQKD